METTCEMKEMKKINVFEMKMVVDCRKKPFREDIHYPLMN